MKTIAALAAGAALLLVPTPAAAAGEEGVVVVAYLVSTGSGVVTGVGTSVALGERAGTIKGWGIASVVTGVVNVVWGIGFLSYAVGPSNCSGWICLDFRGVAAAFGAVNLSVGVANLVLAGVALTRDWKPPAGAMLAPMTLRDARGDDVPGVMLVGRF